MTSVRYLWCLVAFCIAAILATPWLCILGFKYLDWVRTFM